MTEVKCQPFRCIAYLAHAIYHHSQKAPNARYLKRRLRYHLSPPLSSHLDCQLWFLVRPLRRCSHRWYCSHQVQKFRFGPLCAHSCCRFQLRSCIRKKNLRSDAQAASRGTRCSSCSGRTLSAHILLPTQNAQAL